MTEMTIRRMPWTDDVTKRAIIQIPLDGKEQVLELNDLVNARHPDWEFEWITPVQVSTQYTGIPAPGFTFVIRPPSESDYATARRSPDSDRVVVAQMVDVLYHLHHVQSFMIGGPNGRIVVGCQYEQKGDGVQDLSVLSSTLSLLVQFKKRPDEDTENTLTHQFQQQGHGVRPE